MSIVIITIRDTDTGVDIQRSDVSDLGEVNTPAVILGAAMHQNALQYLQRHPAYGRDATDNVPRVH